MQGNHGACSLSTRVQLIADFEAKAQQLDQALQSDSASKINAFRREVEEAWNYLLLYDPRSKEKTLEMIEFFVSHMSKDMEEDLPTEQCKWKILDLARSLSEQGDWNSRTERRRL